MLTITTAILDCINQWAETPREINRGNCDTFANQIETLGFGEAVWGDELSPEDWSFSSEDWFTNYAPYHCLILYQGRYYDSECPEGVKWPDQLPYYRRQIQYWDLYG